MDLGKFSYFKIPSTGIIYMLSKKKLLSTPELDGESTWQKSPYSHNRLGEKACPPSGMRKELFISRKRGTRRLKPLRRLKKDRYCADIMRQNLAAIWLLKLVRQR